MKRKRTLAQKNIIILLLSILPFFIAVALSAMGSSETEYFSVAINISGSQRMRTMLISNYSQLYYSANLDENDSSTQNHENLLKDEITLYKAYYYGLIDGNKEIELQTNHYNEIRDYLLSFEQELSNYIFHARSLIESDNKINDLKYITDHAMSLKDHFHNVTGLFQEFNDNIILRQKRIDILMIVFGSVITFIGLFLSLKIKQKEFHANYDYLTKLKNRHSLYDDIKEMNIKLYSIVFIDLNKFKFINDTFGHATGDDILVITSLRLSSIFGKEYLYRYGGDEFIAFIKMKDEASVREDINTYIHDVKRVLSEPIVDSLGRKHFVGLSMGIISNEVGVDTWENLINLADDLMYDSKTITGNVLACYSPEDLIKREGLSKYIDRVFSEGKIQLKYQPILALCDDKLTCYNITSTWQNKSITYTASEVIPILRRKGYISNVDLLSLHQIEKDYLHNDMKNDVIYIINLAEETVQNYKNNIIMNVLENLKVPHHQVAIKLRHEVLSNSVILEAINLIKTQGYKIAVDNIVLDATLRQIERYKYIDIIKIGNALSNALIEKPNTKNILLAFIKVFNEDQKMVIVEGITSKELMYELKEYCNKQVTNRILYSERYGSL